MSANGRRDLIRRLKVNGKYVLISPYVTRERKSGCGVAQRLLSNLGPQQSDWPATSLDTLPDINRIRQLIEKGGFGVPTSLLLALEKMISSYPAGNRAKIFFPCTNTISFCKNYYFMECDHVQFVRKTQNSQKYSYSCSRLSGPILDKTVIFIFTVLRTFSIDLNPVLS